MKVQIEVDEWYPVYDLAEEKSNWAEIEVTPAFFKKVKKVKEDFEKVQEELEKLWYGANE